ncbi:hypothetical protein IE81DRAFT_308961 [Ceraceosorus guamensis]|uniref:DM2 domain-containing protein n=1 Tax=Ceraceosorus guamensis TaxID=1522189 RepID=A0A316W6W1_9BASI|nr:hypothetical protein IE81DRAFT_308961 [Ceraceosorus guamensis]PWN45344.1 hypothetical protein IE81DRAFT_308961 [Ceraceosorus guamensis]
MSSNVASTPTRAPPAQRPVASLPSQAARPSAASASAALAIARKRNAADALLVPGATSGGGAGSNSSKRGRPTSRALPPSIVRHVPESAVYGDLCRVERSLDWTVARKRAEVSESISKTPKVKRILRIFLSNTCANQPFQRASADGDVPSTLEGTGVHNAENATASTEAEGSNDGGADKAQSSTDAVVTNSADVPSWTLRIEGRLVAPSNLSRAASAQAAQAAATRVGAHKFTNMVRAVVVELQRDQALHPNESNMVEWHRPVPTAVPDRSSAAVGSAGVGEPPLITTSEPALDGLEVKRTGSTPVKAKIVLYPAYTPERYALSPALATLLDVKEETRAGVIAALWGYVKANGLLDENDRRLVRCDAALGSIFNVDHILFHHMPEVVNRHLHPAQPVVIEYWIRTDVAQHKHPTAYDIEMELDDWSTRKARESVLDAFDPKGEAAQEIAELDDRIAQATSTLSTRALSRDFLSTFSQNPHAHLRSWLASQSRDLDVVLGSGGLSGNGGTGTGTGSGGALAGLTDEELRRAGTFRGKWVDEAVVVLESARYAERLLGLQRGEGGPANQALPPHALAQQGHGNKSSPAAAGLPHAQQVAGASQAYGNMPPPTGRPGSVVNTPRR